MPLTVEETLRRLPQAQTGSVILWGKEYFYQCSSSLRNNYQELFLNQSYYFESDNDSPVILDVGAYTGLSVLYFKKLYPRASITAFEADPLIFKSLSKNMENFGMTDVQLHNKAAWKEDAVMNFHSSGNMSGHLVETQGQQMQPVPTIRISPFLQNGVDPLKLDVEGSELEILRECGDELLKVKRIFLEYHSPLGRASQLHELLVLLHQYGFDYVINDSVSNHRGMIARQPPSMDFAYAVNLAAWRSQD
jgi:FkbM family methyltransferase